MRMLGGRTHYTKTRTKGYLLQSYANLCVVRNCRLARHQCLLEPRQHSNTAQRHVGRVHGRVKDTAGLSKGLDRG